jgi:hypothetical protein
MNSDEASKRGKRSGWVAGALGLLILLLLGRAFLPGQVLLPLDIVTQQWPPWQGQGVVDEAHNPLLSDVVSYIYPVKEFAADAVRRGEFPLWNPYVLTGTPFTYNTQAGLFYPLSLLYYGLPATTAVDLTILLQMALGGLFMALYLRQIGLRSTAVLAGAIVFLFNGLMVVWLEWQVVHAAIIWLPLALYFVEKLAGAMVKGERAAAGAYSVAAAMAMAVPWLGGHWNWTLYTSLTAGIYLAARLGRQWWTARGARPSLLRLWPVTVVPTLALTLALVQVLPAALYLSRSHRQDLSFSASMQLGLLNRGVALLVPRFFGDPITRTWWGIDNFNETTFYVGILPLLLAGLAVALRRDWYTRFFTIWGAIGLLWALGPLYGILYVLPVFGGLQPSRAAVLVVFCGGVLAALGLDRLLDPVAGRPKWGKPAFGLILLLPIIVSIYLIIYRAKVIATWAYLWPQVGWFLLWLGGSALLLWAWQGKHVKRPWLGVTAVVWLTLDLFAFGYTYNPVRPVSELYPPTATTAFLQADSSEPYRMATPPQGLAYPPNSNLVPRLQNLSGYEPGIPETLAAYVNAAEGGDAIRFERKLQPLAGLDSPLLDALNVKYIVTSADVWGEAAPTGPRAKVAAWRALPLEMQLEKLPAGLQRIDVPLRGEGEVTLRVLSSDATYEFAHAAAILDSDGLNGYTNFYIDPFPAEWGGDFLLRVEGAGEAGLDGEGELAAQTFALSRPGLAFEEGKTRVYLRQEYLPRAWMASHAEIATDAETALTAVLANQNLLADVVILETMGQDPPPETSFTLKTPDVIVQKQTLNSIILRATGPGFLVLADAWYPGWAATVDGVETAVYRANSVSRAVFLPEGRHDVMFRFRPADFYAGAVVSGAAWLSGLIYLLWAARRGRTRA